jgi:hypothetical protein
MIVHHDRLTLCDQRDIYVPLTKSLFKSAGITVSHFFSMVPFTLKYLYSVEPVRKHFPAKQPCTNDTVCNAAISVQLNRSESTFPRNSCVQMILCAMLLSLFSWTGQKALSRKTAVYKWYCMQCCYLYSVEPVRIAALHTVSFVHHCFVGKCILAGSSE